MYTGPRLGSLEYRLQEAMHPRFGLSPGRSRDHVRLVHRAGRAFAHSQAMQAMEYAPTETDRLWSHLPPPLEAIERQRPHSAGRRVGERVSIRLSGSCRRVRLIVRLRHAVSRKGEVARETTRSLSGETRPEPASRADYGLNWGCHSVRRSPCRALRWHPGPKSQHGIDISIEIVVVMLYSYG